MKVRKKRHYVIHLLRFSIRYRMPQEINTRTTRLFYVWLCLRKRHANVSCDKVDADTNKAPNRRGRSCGRVQDYLFASLGILIFSPTHLIDYCFQGQHLKSESAPTHHTLGSVCGLTPAVDGHVRPGMNIAPFHTCNSSHYE